MKDTQPCLVQGKTSNILISLSLCKVNNALINMFEEEIKNTYEGRAVDGD